jgi:hypothetical protein
MEGSARIEISALNADIKLYLEGQIGKESRLQRHILHDPSLRGDIIHGIAAKARGMFVFPHHLT